MKDSYRYQYAERRQYIQEITQQGKISPVSILLERSTYNSFMMPAHRTTPKCWVRFMMLKLKILMSAY